MYKIFFGIFFGFAKISSTFAPSKGTLSYGVMVTQQILVLLFQVRILVAQQERMVKSHPFFWLLYYARSYVRVGNLSQGQRPSPPLRQKGLQGPWELATARAEARAVTPFPSARRGCFVMSGSKPLLLKGGVGEDCQGLSAKGFASRRDTWRWLWGRELAAARAVGSLRDAFPLPAGGIPAKSQTNEILHGSRWERFLF